MVKVGDKEIVADYVTNLLPAPRVHRVFETNSYFPHFSTTYHHHHARDYMLGHLLNPGRTFGATRLFDDLGVDTQPGHSSWGLTQLSAWSSIQHTPLPGVFNEF